MCGNNDPILLSNFTEQTFIQTEISQRAIFPHVSTITWAEGILEILTPTIKSSRTSNTGPPTTRGPGNSTFHLPQNSDNKAPIHLQNPKFQSCTTIWKKVIC